MKYLEYRETRKHGTFSFPVGYYHQLSTSPRYLMPYHWQHYCEIIHIINGSFNLTLNGYSRMYSKGDVVFLPGGCLHGGEPTDNSCVYDCIVFDLQLLLKDNNACSKTINDILNNSITVDYLLTEKSSRVLPVVEKLEDALSSKDAGYEFTALGCLYQLFGIIINEELYSESRYDKAFYQRLDSIKNVFTFIAENYSNSITLDDFAKVSGMNPKYLCRYFRSMTDRTPIDYLNYYRIEVACEMLAMKNYSIKEVAISCGFNDESYFIKTFRKYKNTTPKRYMSQTF